MKKTEHKGDDSWIKTDTDELAKLLQRLDSSDFSDGDKNLIRSLVATVLTLRNLLDRRTGRLMTILRKIFGLKSEKRAKSGRRPGDDDKKGGSGVGGDKRRGGNGRNGKDDYPGANKVAIKHDSLSVGDPCPACQEATLTVATPSTAYRWTGQTPLTLTLYELERLLCQNCKTTFTANVPGEALDTSKLDPSTPLLAGQVKERSFDASAAAQIASLRFEMGVPHYRLAEIQAQQGVPLAASTQYRVMDEALRQPATAVFKDLTKKAGAAGELYLNDDTKARVMSLEQEAKKAREAAQNSLKETTAPPDDAKKTNLSDHKSRTPPIPKVQTSAIVTRFGEQTICLYFTGHKNAGANLADILAHRAKGAPIPKQMCDALAGNKPGAFVTLLGNCLDHARRKYNDVQVSFPDEVAYVLDALGKVYHYDQIAKSKRLNDEDRLIFHQTNSEPVLMELKVWVESGLAEKRIEPNSTLGGAVKYMTKHWTELTAFLRVSGMPLSSAEVERLIKRCIRHRKNSLHYKTERGAELGDMLMSLAQTCRYAKQSTHAYFTALAKFAEKVVLDPGAWLPWNYKSAIPSMPS